MSLMEFRCRYSNLRFLRFFKAVTAVILLFARFRLVSM
jgi:hypothetical protein